MEQVVSAYHVQKRIDLKYVRKLLSKFLLVKREHTYLLYKFKNNAFVYIKDYGSVVFLNCTENLGKEIIKVISGETVMLKNLPKESFEIKTSNTTDVDFGEIQVKELNIDTVHIICLNLAQSVALMNYVHKTSDLYNKTLVYSKQLEKIGRFKLSKKNMRQFIGKTMNIKNNVAEDLFVFEAPEVAWNSKDLSVLDYKLRDELDIVKRHQSIVNSLNTIKENLDLFSDIIHHKYTSMLEWIIILLILFEIVQVFIGKTIS